jgi:hypothetical protein
VAELRKLFDLYMGQLAGLSGPDAEAAMKAALEAVDQLDGALSLEKVCMCVLSSVFKGVHSMGAVLVCALLVCGWGVGGAGGPAGRGTQPGEGERIRSVGLDSAGSGDRLYTVEMHMCVLQEVAGGWALAASLLGHVLLTCACVVCRSCVCVLYGRLQQQLLRTCNASWSHMCLW